MLSESDGVVGIALYRKLLLFLVERSTIIALGPS